MQPTNLNYNAVGTIDMMLPHPEFGVIPFTASPDDPEAHGRDLFARAKAGEFGPIAPYVDPLTPEQRKEIESRAMKVTEYQAKSALMQTPHTSGKDCYSVVEAFMTSPHATAQIKLAWATCRDYERTDDKIYLIARDVLGFGPDVIEQRLDDLFILAKGIH